MYENAVAQLAQSLGKSTRGECCGCQLQACWGPGRIAGKMDSNPSAMGLLYSEPSGQECSLYFLYSLPSTASNALARPLLNLACHLGFSLEREGVVSHKLIEGQRLTSGEPLDVVGHATRFAFSIESLQVG